MMIMLAVVVLTVVALLPNRKTTSAPRTTPDTSPPPENAEQIISVENDNQIVENLTKTIDAVAEHQAEIDKVAKGIQNVPEEAPTFEPIPEINLGVDLMPLRGGAFWKYDIFGDPDLVRSNELTIRLVHEPEGQGAGLMEIELGERVDITPIYDTDGMRTGGFPFFVPRELLDTRPFRVEGTTLPKRRQLVAGAVWTEIQHRKLIYRYQDTHGKTQSLKADAVIKNRAHTRTFETVVVPAGRYGAFRIEWIGRVAITAAGRPILAHLTSEPFRRETMWVAPGVGVVKREISYLDRGISAQSVTLALKMFEPGQDCRFSDL